MEHSNKNLRAEFVSGTAQSLITKVIFYSVALTFTFLGYSLQFTGNLTSKTEVFLMIGSWISLLVSGLTGLWSAHNFTNYSMELKSMFDLEEEYERSKKNRNRNKDELIKMEEKAKMQHKSADISMTLYRLNRRVHLFCLVIGLTIFAVTRGMTVFSNLNP